MKIGSFDLEKKVLIIAEIGNNHEGDAATALQMVRTAAEAGIPAVKIQVINPERLVNVSQQARITQLGKYRLPWPVIEEMAGIARSHGILFMASAFDVDSLERVSGLVDAIKIASGDLDCDPLLKKAATIGKPVILSTGMSSLEEIRRSVGVIAECLPAGSDLHDFLALLHCVSLYPAPHGKTNLRVIETLKREFGLTTGYSDHTLGIEAAIVSMSLGVRLIEKHFTLDRSRTTFRDHALSADAGEMKKLVQFAEGYADLLGDGIKRISADEAAMAAVARRSIVAARDLPVDTILTERDLDFVRPRDGFRPEDAGRIVGRRVRSALRRHDVIKEENLG